ncbi:hypothetical protein ACPZ19_00800 [Amycolatopsis lurida]
MLLTEFCARLPSLRRSLRGEDRALVEQTVLAARNGEQVDAQITQLLGFRQPGVQGTEQPDAGMTEVHGPSIGVTGAYFCPTGQCPRVVYRKAGEDLPTCPVFARDLRFVADE